MKLHRLDAPGSIDGIVLHEEAAPSPGPRQVLMRVRANSINFRDLLIARGQYMRNPLAGVIPLSDGAGEVSAVGSGVTRVKPGDRVAATFARGWIGGPRQPGTVMGDRGGSEDGMLAEYVVLDEDEVVTVPDHLTFEEAATLPCAGVTAWVALHGFAPLTAGDTVLVQGTGGVSIFALQFARLFGASVIATTSSDAKLERLKALGADHVINYAADPAWERQVQAATGGRGVDVVVEVVGDFARSLKCVRHGGRISFIGWMGGRKVDLTVTGIIARHISVHGIGVGSRADFEAMNRAIDMHALRPVVDKVCAFDEAREAYRALQGRSHFGKIVIGAA
jgi:NADPH:quinone reductase-like Zn-dependent oxidoreductase